MCARFGTAVLACLAVLAAVGPGVSYADGVSVTGGVTAVTSSSAVFQGLVYTSSSDTQWFFQYGTAADALNATTPPQALSQPGLTAVSNSVSNLAAKTTYFYRLVVVDQTAAGAAHTGDTLNFATSDTGGNPGGGNPPPVNATPKPQFGVATLAFRTLAVDLGAVTIPIRCAGTPGTACKGTVALSTNTAHPRTITCASARFSTTAGHTAQASLSLSRACRALLAAARGHRLGATLNATFTTHQRAVKKSVTLVG
jgi:hypothetical protein